MNLVIRDTENRPIHALKREQNESEESGTLFVVATPIGNREDFTYRAVRVLKEADVIACEDTRVSKKLLDFYNVSTPLISFHQHSKESKIDTLLDKLNEGKTIALITDAGTPGVSDPGNVLVARAVEEGFCVIPIPGPSAVTAIASVAGIDMQQFVFFAYPPHKKGRETFFKRVITSDIPVIYYDSPHRVMKNLELLQSLDSSKHIILGRELTKLHEEIVRGSVHDVLMYFHEREDTVRGEFVVVVY